MFAYISPVIDRFRFDTVYIYKFVDRFRFDTVYIYKFVLLQLRLRFVCK